MILLDDSFASIVKAVEQGRGVYANVKKMVTYIFSHNFAELFPYVFAVIGGVGLVPLGAIQILSIDLGSDVLPGLALGTEPPEPGVMAQPPRPRSERLLSRPTLRRVVFIGAIQSVFAVSGFLYVLLSHGWAWGDTTWMNPASPHYGAYLEAVTMTQAAIVAGQVANGFGCRTERESLFKVGIFSNKWIVFSEMFAVAVDGRHLLRAVPAEHPQDRATLAERLGIPRHRDGHFVLRRGSEKMAPASPHGGPRRLSRCT